MKIAMLCAALLIGVSVQAEAQVTTNKSNAQIPKICRNLTTRTAPLIISRQETIDELKYRFGRNTHYKSHRIESSSGLEAAIGGVIDYMAQSYEAAPRLTEQELATLGYSYCMQRLI